MRRLILFVFAAAIVVFTLFWIVTEPERADASDVVKGEPDLANGRTVFLAAGCGSCHATPGQPDKLLLGGGLRIESPAGAFVAPNISPDPEHGIGAWTAEEFATAVLKGVSPEGRHYYPAFPYTSYRGMRPEDVRDLHAYILTLAPSDSPAGGHEFPFDSALVRRGAGLWKLLHVDTPAAPAPENPHARGRYLVEVLGHCAECHSPRDKTAGIIGERRLGGGRLADGDVAPNLTPGKGGIGDWTEEDIAFFLTDGTTPEGDVVGGEMRRVIANTSQLSDEDRAAIAAYLKSLAPIDRP